MIVKNQSLDSRTMFVSRDKIGQEFINKNRKKLRSKKEK